MGYALSQIIGVVLPVDPRLMLLADVEYFQLDSHGALLATMLTAASLLIAKCWKLQEVPHLQEWTAKIKNIWLLSKLSAMCKYRAGDQSALRKFTHQRAALVDSGYINEAKYIRDSLLMVIWKAFCTLFKINE